MNAVKMKRLILVLLLILSMMGCEEKVTGQATGSSIKKVSSHDTGSDVNVPVKGKITMVDLGADKCVPCKMMAPILVELKEEYRDKAVIVFLDVWKDKAPAKRFGIRAIPTQIFFDENGKEVYRHVGFMSKEDITAQLKIMGID